jgi:NACHT-associated inactive restriction endonuclease
VSLVNAQPNEKQVGDKGIDGVARFPLNTKYSKASREFGRILVSVKGGKTVGPQFVRDLVGTVESQKAEMGILITMANPTKGVLDAGNHGGTYTLPVNGQTFPRVQVITVAELLTAKRPKTPLTLLPYIQAVRRGPQPTTEPVF